jgi:hypothetical protein
VAAVIHVSMMGSTALTSSIMEFNMLYMVTHHLVLLKIVQLSVVWVLRLAAFRMGRRGLYELLPQV